MLRNVSFIYKTFTLRMLLALTVFAILVVANGNSRAQSLPVVLQITSPADGTVVKPGEVVAVVVAPTQGDTFSKVFLIGEHPIGMGLHQVLRVPPYEFAVTIPKDISAAGKYFIRAMGVTPGEKGGISVAIHLDVEPSASISSISVEPSGFQFHTVGSRIPLKVFGAFSDGSTIDITKSSGTTYSSGDTTAVTVSTTGIVTAVGVGKYGVSPVVVHYGNQTFAVQVSTQRLSPSAH
jgi:hypothetical protein